MIHTRAVVSRRIGNVFVAYRSQRARYSTLDCIRHVSDVYRPQQARYSTLHCIGDVFDVYRLKRVRYSTSDCIGVYLVCIDPLGSDTMRDNVSRCIDCVSSAPCLIHSVDVYHTCIGMYCTDTQIHLYRHADTLPIHVYR